MDIREFDIVVVGGGHAGCEAAAVAARLGVRVALVTFDTKANGRLSCNPAIGGLAKGNLVRELDALGGVMAQVTDASTIQFRHLNTRKGLAVRSSRAQVDIDLYPKAMQEALGSIDNLEIIEDEVVSITTNGDEDNLSISSVGLGSGGELICSAVVLTTGTFLSAMLHCGDTATLGGRVGEGSAMSLGEAMKSLGVKLARLKTGTPPRLRADSIDFSQMESQESVGGHFSFSPPDKILPSITCHIVYTNEKTHDIVRENLDKSSVYGGGVNSVGPRYCPSIEDKVVKFPQRSRHLLFLEPEGLNTDRIYVNGLSTSMPAYIQELVLRSMPGMENAVIEQAGYAVEYDYSDPRQLGHDLQFKGLKGLYMAGQLNGTSGYEEAAVQGFIAGVCAAHSVLGREPLILGRDEAYIGVLIDDLVTRGVGGEPYRMFTSRAEHRLSLREDNADRRLMKRGRDLGLINDERWLRFEQKMEAINRSKDTLSKKVSPTKDMIEKFKKAGLGELNKQATVEQLLRRPEYTYELLSRVIDLPELTAEEAEQVETDVKYAGYLQREKVRAEQAKKMSGVSLIGVDFASIAGLSNEVIQRLARACPATLDAASRIPSVTPAAITVLALFMARSPRSSKNQPL
jgi:tRNA uridine 5-carboxymethylaminomethyl modification enzyme